jgi:hypothetical protein
MQKNDNALSVSMRYCRCNKRSKKKPLQRQRLNKDVRSRSLKIYVRGNRSEAWRMFMTRRKKTNFQFAARAAAK